MAIDRSSGAFLGSDGRRYYEVEADVFVLDGIVEEGVIACHGSGSHGGHIVLKAVLRATRWRVGEHVLRRRRAREESREMREQYVNQGIARHRRVSRQTR